MLRSQRSAPCGLACGKKALGLRKLPEQKSRVGITVFSHSHPSAWSLLSCSSSNTRNGFFLDMTLQWLETAWRVKWITQRWKSILPSQTWWFAGKSWLCGWWPTSWRTRTVGMTLTSLTSVRLLLFAFCFIFFFLLLIGVHANTG